MNNRPSDFRSASVHCDSAIRRPCASAGASIVTPHGGSSTAPARGPTLGTIDFFVYSRASPSAASVEHDRALDEEHWSYMDQFADGMIARGPTLGADRETWTGSIHIVELASAEAAREFIEREPYNRAGLYEHHIIRRFKILLGRTMWQSPGETVEPGFFVIAEVAAEAGEHAPAVRLPDFTALPRERLIVHGELLTADDVTPTGVLFALQAPTRESVAALLGEGQAALEGHFDVQILDWEFGGRR
jgi:uncharacterized protein YciI